MFEVDKFINVFVEVRVIFIDVVFGGVLEGRYFRVIILFLNVVFNGVVWVDGLGNFLGVGFGVGSFFLLIGGGYGGCGGGNINDSCVVYGFLYKVIEFGSGGGIL